VNLRVCWASLALSLAAAFVLLMGGTSAAIAAPEDEDVLGIVAVVEEVAAEPPLDVPALIVDAARRWSVDESTLLRIAWCESRWDPGARGPAGLAGLFQFSPITWSWVSVEVGYAGASPYDVRANAEAAAWLYRHEGPRHWGCK
jgi:soluble lytic murein transglycosylase-like protein